MALPFYELFIRMDLGDFQKYLSSKNEDAAILFHKLWNQYGNVPVHFDDIRTYAVAIVGKGIYINNDYLKKVLNNSSSYYSFISVLFHELGHFLRFEEIGDSVERTFRENDLQRFLKMSQTEENAAVEFSNENLQKFFEETKDNHYLNHKQNSGIVQANQIIPIFNLIQKHIHEYPNSGDLVLAILKGEINPMNEVTKIRMYIRNLLREFIKASMAKDAQPVVEPEKPKIKPGIKPGPAEPARRERRIIQPKIHPGADPMPKAKNKSNLN